VSRDDSTDLTESLRELRRVARRTNINVDVSSHLKTTDYVFSVVVRGPAVSEQAVLDALSRSLSRELEPSIDSSGLSWTRVGHPRYAFFRWVVAGYASPAKLLNVIDEFKLQLATQPT
jgi:hypothetical protein